MTMTKEQKERWIKFLEDGWTRFVIMQRQNGASFDQMSWRALADYIGVSDTSLSRWKRGNPADPENLDKLAVWYGPEVYEICGHTARTPREELIQGIIRKWHLLTPEAKQKHYDEIMKDAEEQEEKVQGKGNSRQERMSAA